MRTADASTISFVDLPGWAAFLLAAFFGSAFLPDFAGAAVDAAFLPVVPPDAAAFFADFFRAAGFRASGFRMEAAFFFGVTFFAAFFGSALRARAVEPVAADFRVAGFFTVFFGAVFFGAAFFGAAFFGAAFLGAAFFRAAFFRAALPGGAFSRAVAFLFAAMSRVTAFLVAVSFLPAVALARFVTFLVAFLADFWVLVPEARVFRPAPVLVAPADRLDDAGAGFFRADFVVCAAFFTAFVFRGAVVFRATLRLVVVFFAARFSVFFAAVFFVVFFAAVFVAVFFVVCLAFVVVLAADFFATLLATFFLPVPAEEARFGADRRVEPPAAFRVGAALRRVLPVFRLPERADEPAELDFFRSAMFTSHRGIAVDSTGVGPGRAGAATAGKAPDYSESYGPGQCCDRRAHISGGSTEPPEWMRRGPGQGCRSA